MHPPTTAPQSSRFWNILIPAVTTTVFVIITSILCLNILVTAENGARVSLWESIQLLVAMTVLNLLLTTLHIYGNGLINESYWNKLRKVLDALDEARTSHRRIGPSLVWITIATLVASPVGLVISLGAVAITALRASILLMATISRFIWSCRPGAEEITGS